MMIYHILLQNNEPKTTAFGGVEPAVYAGLVWLAKIDTNGVVSATRERYMHGGESDDNLSS